ncbi:hypothetical protein [Asticcacaulis sp. AC460]|uniref:hypothetical protein n=1 Tax=Asticcacaulis sp. AC460 TaxID=1282360 RepID=UPI00138AFFA1|nr:hypothetical protein [Asticcacaulis sp. AC460]
MEFLIMAVLAIIVAMLVYVFRAIPIHIRFMADRERRHGNLAGAYHYESRLYGLTCRLAILMLTGFFGFGLYALGSTLLRQFGLIA